VQIKHQKITIAVIIALAVFCGCATERHIAPTLSEPPRTGLELNPPILGAVFDGRATQDPKDAGAPLTPVIQSIRQYQKVHLECDK